MNKDTKKEPSSTMIYISNLPFTTNDEQLKDLFKGFEIKTAYIAKRRNGRSKGFGFVNLAKESDQKGAIEQVDQKEFDGRRLTAKCAFNDERRTESGELKEEFRTQNPQRTPSETVVYVSNLPFSYKNEDLKKLFEGLEVKVCTVATRQNGRSKGFGFVEFNTKEDQQKALVKDQQKIEDRNITVKPSTNYRGEDQNNNRSPRRNNNRSPRRNNNRSPRRNNRSPRNNSNRRPRNNSNRDQNNKRSENPTQQNNNKSPRRNNDERQVSTQPENTLYVSNLPFDLDDNDLKQIFNEFHVKNANIVTRPNGKSRGFGFVQFESSNDQNEALKALDQSEVNGRVVTVKLANGKNNNRNYNNRNDNNRNDNNRNYNNRNYNNRNYNNRNGNNRNYNNRNGNNRNFNNRNGNNRSPRNDNREPSKTMIYVSNLPFSVTDTGLSDIFKGLKVSKAYIATNQGGRSKGFGFVDFASNEDQQKALKSDGTEVQGRVIVVQPAKQIENKTN